MKFTKHTFLMLGLASVLSLGQQRASYATYCDKNHSVSAGNVCLNTAVHQCRPGCYCTGGYVSSQTVSVSDFKTGCAARWSSWNNHSGGWTLCPADFPNSAEKTSTINDCYVEVGGATYKYGLTKKCPEGKYLPKGSWECASCSEKDDLAFDKYCPGTDTVRFSNSIDQCIKTCQTGYMANSDKTGCEKIPKKRACPKGTYVPRQQDTCELCPEGFVCPYDKEYIVEDNWKDEGKLYPDQACGPDSENPDRTNMIANRERDGCTECGKGYKPNSTYTECVDAEIEVEPGKYLLANRVEPVPCSGAKKFCPGGWFWKKEIEQGRYDCPFNSTPKKINRDSPGFDGCDLNLTQEQMKNGISGNGECWKKTDPADYRYCIYGMRFELPDNQSE